MWGALNALAEKAKAAAADLEGQLNESVGMEPGVEPSSQTLLSLSGGHPTAVVDYTTTNNITHDDDDDDVWKDDDFALDGDPTAEEENDVTPTPASEQENKPSPSATPPLNNHATTELPTNGMPPTAEMTTEPTITTTTTSREDKTTPVVPEATAEDNSGWDQEDEDLEDDDDDDTSDTLDKGASPQHDNDDEADPPPIQEQEEEKIPMPPPPPSTTLRPEPDTTTPAATPSPPAAASEDSPTVLQTNEKEVIPPPDTAATVEAPPPPPEGPDAPPHENVKPVVPPTVPPEISPEPSIHQENNNNDNKDAPPVPSLDSPPDNTIIGVPTTSSSSDQEVQQQQDETIATPPQDDDAVLVQKSDTPQEEVVDGMDSGDIDTPENDNSHDGDTADDAKNDHPIIPMGNGSHPIHEDQATHTADPDISPATTQLLQEKDAALEKYRALVEQLQTELGQRESQLFSKTEQMTSMQSMFEKEKQDLVQMVDHTKTEAKRRIQIAKERVEKAEAQVAQLSRGQSDDAQKQAQIISELRSEGEKLALKQAEMEKAVRSAKGEARNLREALETEQAARDTALETMEELKAELKSTKESLTLARKGESQANKLDAELQSAREDAERKTSTILSLEQQVKELKAEAKELNTELQSARKGAAMESEREQKKLRKEQSNLIDDFETKLRTAEKEAAVREDALRLEVAELRKRWQDAVRRADTLSMDVQSSTAPLMRQLESMERQNRARAAAWTEMETKLREELEETVIANEKMTKEKSEMKTKLLRMVRSSKENETDLRQAQNELEEKTYKVKELEDKLLHMEEEAVKRKKEWAEVERLANEGVARVRSEMSQTMLEADERHRSQIDSLQADLRNEREKRVQLEQQVQELVDKAGAIVPVQNVASLHMHRANSTPTPRLRKSEGQAEILAGALNLSGMSDDDMDDDDDEDMDEGPVTTGSSSFAALEELTSRLKTTKLELNTLRQSLEESEKTRTKLMDELAEARTAREKLPLFEARVQELTTENEELALEVQGLQEDIADVRELYRNQLNALLEEKAAADRSVSEQDGQGDDDGDVEPAM